MGAKTERICSTVDAEILKAAREFKINISQAAADGIAAAVERQKKIKELGL